MCDCVTCISKSGDYQSTLFAKNSDREPNEIQLVEHYPRSDRSGSLKTTYLDVDYDGNVNEVVISRPYWMWGAEMGFNEYGVSAGNEAIFTRGKYNRNGLLGMDLLRLALEKAKSASEGAGVIAEYLEKYGQGGSSSRNGKLHYNNSVMLTDRKEALVMDLVGKEWRLRRIKGPMSISNFSAASDRLLIPVEQSGNFSLKHDIVFTNLGKGETRQKHTRHSLDQSGPGITPMKLMETMRMHSRGHYHPANGDNSDVCMHSGPFSRINKTVNSMITETSSEYTLGWFTYSSNPCISLYKPVLVGGGIEHASSYSRTYWLYAENIHRKLMFCQPEIFQEAMSQTVYNQELINEFTKSVRDTIKSGGSVSQDEVLALEIAVRDIDASHLLTLNSLAQPDSSVINSGYRKWLAKNNGLLEATTSLN